MGLGPHLCVAAEDAVELDQLGAALALDGEGEAALTGGAVGPALLRDGVEPVLQGQVAGIHQLGQGLGKVEVVDAVVAHGQPRHGGKIHRGRHTAHEVEDQQFHIKLVMDEAVSRHGELLSADGDNHYIYVLIIPKERKKHKGYFLPAKDAKTRLCRQRRGVSGLPPAGGDCRPAGDSNGGGSKRGKERRRFDRIALVFLAVSILSASAGKW